jgi:hypothetical protein
MRKRSIAGTLAAAAIAAVLPCALALAAPDQAAPKPAAEMANLKFFDGSWTCEGKLEASPMGPAGTNKSTVRSHSDLGGFWQSGMVKSTGSSMPGATMEGMFHMTYDAGSKQYVMLWVDNMGAYAQEMSSGWEGDKLAFAGDMAMGGKKMAVRDTFTKGADGSLVHAWEAQMDGKWTPLGSETCKKQRPGTTN